VAEKQRRKATRGRKTREEEDAEQLLDQLVGNAATIPTAEIPTAT
jgi:hypothetical protein